MSWMQSPSTVTVVITDREHHEPMRSFVSLLRRAGFETYILHRVNYASVSRVPRPQVVLADVGANNFASGANSPANLQATWEYVPIILLASVDEVTQLRFSTSLHDFLTLPTTTIELDARIRFALWKSQGSAPAPRDHTEINGLRMDMATYEVWAHNRPVELTYKEFELLKFLVTHPRRVYTRSELLEKVWESEYFGGTRTVDVHILRLRSKLGPVVGKMIHTVRNVGYRFG